MSFKKETTLILIKKGYAYCKRLIHSSRSIWGKIQAESFFEVD